ncbi:MAG: sugar phosphate isomerase/epimerase family protein [Verrucomicrobiota bacterium]
MFEDWPFEKAFGFARDVGYTGIEIAPFTLAPDAYEITPERCAETKTLIEDLGLETVGVHWLLAKTEGYYLTSPDPAMQEKTGKYFAQLAKVCRNLGGDIMVLGSPHQRNLLPGISHDQAMDYAAATLKIADTALRDHGVTIALEPLGPGEGDFLNTAALGVELMGLVDSPNVRLHLDVKAMSTEADPVPDIIRRNAETMAHFHANDPNLLGPGMGEVDFDPIFAALTEVDYEGWVSVEVFDYSPGVETICRESMATMKASLANAS